MIKNSKNDEVPIFEYKETEYEFFCNFDRNLSDNCSYTVNASHTPIIMDGVKINTSDKTENKNETKAETIIENVKEEKSEVNSINNITAKISSIFKKKKA